jgi:hypothetical protein
MFSCDKFCARMSVDYCTFHIYTKLIKFATWDRFKRKKQLWFNSKPFTYIQQQQLLQLYNNNKFSSVHLCSQSINIAWNCDFVKCTSVCGIKFSASATRLGKVRLYNGSSFPGSFPCCWPHHSSFLFLVFVMRRKKIQGLLLLAGTFVHQLVRWMQGFERRITYLREGLLISPGLHNALPCPKPCVNVHELHFMQSLLRYSVLCGDTCPTSVDPPPFPLACRGQDHNSYDTSLCLGSSGLLCCRLDVSAVALSYCPSTPLWMRQFSGSCSSYFGPKQVHNFTSRRALPPVVTVIYERWPDLGNKEKQQCDLIFLIKASCAVFFLPPSTS